MKPWILLGICLSVAHADSPAPIALPDQPTTEEQTPSAVPVEQAPPMSTSVHDPNAPDWIEYDNHIVRFHARLNTAWTMMEVKETRQSGAVTLTLSRMPMISFAITRQPIDGSFESYLSTTSLAAQYPSGFKRTRGALAGRQAFITRGKNRDDRIDESYFLSDRSFITEVTFSAPEENWKDAETTYFAGIKHSFRWIP